MCSVSLNLELERIVSVTIIFLGFVESHDEALTNAYCFLDKREKKI